MIVLKVILESLIIAVAYTACMALMIRNGAVPLVFLYPQEVQDIALAGGHITRDRIKRNRTAFVIFSYLFLIAGVVIAFYFINGARTFLAAWWQVTLFVEIWNLYDAFIIDATWVRKTNAWTIPGAEGMDYIPKYSKLKKRIAIAIIGAPVIGAGLALIFSLLGGVA